MGMTHRMLMSGRAVRNRSGHRGSAIRVRVRLARIERRVAAMGRHIHLRISALQTWVARHSSRNTRRHEVARGPHVPTYWASHLSSGRVVGMVG
jgi:hypothetical protein